MRGLGVLAQIFGLAPKDAGEDAEILLTERAPDWWTDKAIWKVLREEYPDYYVGHGADDKDSAIC